MPNHLKCCPAGIVPSSFELADRNNSHARLVS